VAAHVTALNRLAVTVVGALVVLGFAAASAPSQSAEGDAEIRLVTAGSGTLRISPAQNGPSERCEPGLECEQHYKPGTRVVLNAVPNKGHSFAGWSDFGCRNSSTRCILTAYAGTRYVAAHFSPVTLRIMVNEKSDPENNVIAHPFGLISVKPKPKRPCSLNDGDRCEYPLGTTVTLSGEYEDPDYFWIGACKGNRGGKLDSHHDCRLRLLGNEVVGAGWKNAGGIPPPLGSGIAVVVAGRGKVTGRVINGSETLACPPSCIISGLTRNDYVRLTARGSRFHRWSNGSSARTQPAVPMSSTNRIQAVFR
jgi:hypothetical protein